MQQVLLGYLVIPDSMDKPVELQINPEGMEDRGKSQVSLPLMSEGSELHRHRAWICFASVP